MKDISLHIMDIVQNSISAGAGLIEIKVRRNEAGDLYVLTVSDNGGEWTGSTSKRGRSIFIHPGLQREGWDWASRFSGTARNSRAVPSK
jgi:hypothetical protein